MFLLLYITIKKKICTDDMTEFWKNIEKSRIKKNSKSSINI